MLTSTLRYLKCPSRNGKCQGHLVLESGEKKVLRPDVVEVLSGQIVCQGCKSSFPILAGVAVVLPDVEGYLLAHVKGISRWVPDSEIPKRYRKEFIEAREELEAEHIEEDLESQRVNALYLMNHYLRVTDPQKWWAPEGSEVGSPLIEELVQKYWDHGPLAQIRDQLAEYPNSGNPSFVELGCGVGGLFSQIHPRVGSYLGLDSSFASIAWARKLAFGDRPQEELSIPGDLFQGEVARKVTISTGWAKPTWGKADFIVCDVEHPPLKHGLWDISAALNMIDMLDAPAQLPALQWRLLSPGGLVIQSCPYIWHAKIAKGLRNSLPKTVKTSTAAVEWIYQKAGFELKTVVNHLPWLFFKHLRQLEVYSVHLIFGKKTG